MKLNYDVHYNDELNDILIKVCKELDIPIVLGRRIVWYMFNVLTQSIKEKGFKSVRFLHLGTFGVTPRRIKQYEMKKMKKMKIQIK